MKLGFLALLMFFVVGVTVTPRPLRNATQAEVNEGAMNYDLYVTPDTFANCGRWTNAGPANYYSADDTEFVGPSIKFSGVVKINVEDSTLHGSWAVGGALVANGSQIYFTNQLGQRFGLAVNAQTNGFIFIPQ